jgi:hypothetical protein
MNTPVHDLCRVSQAELARAFGVSVAIIADVIHRRSRARVLLPALTGPGQLPPPPEPLPRRLHGLAHQLRLHHELPSCWVPAPPLSRPACPPDRVGRVLGAHLERRSIELPDLEKPLDPRAVTVAPAT